MGPTALPNRGSGFQPRSIPTRYDLRRRASHLACPFTGWRPPVPSGPLYSRKRTSHAPRPLELGRRIEIDRGWKPLPRNAAGKGVRPFLQTRDNDGRGLWAGGTISRIKRTEGSHLEIVSPGRGPVRKAQLTQQEIGTITEND